MNIIDFVESIVYGTHVYDLKKLKIVPCLFVDPI